MAYNSSIEWTQSSWNPVTGCTKISEGCKYCYAEIMARRLKAMGQKNYVNGFDTTVHEDMFDVPSKWKKPQLIFVNSMSDIFHESLSFKIVEKIFKTMNECSWHTFQVLTKRAHILYEYSKYLNWTKNIWMGVTVESYRQLNRLEHLKKSKAKIKFVSFEPLLTKIDDFNYSDIDWVIVGGESGPGCRPLEKDWVLCIQNICIKNSIPFYFKQWGGVRKKKNGRLLDNKLWSEMPLISKTSMV